LEVAIEVKKSRKMANGKWKMAEIGEKAISEAREARERHAHSVQPSKH
jgi:hypothetical protein